MTDNADRLRIEIAFEGTQVLNVYVPVSTADDLDRDTVSIPKIVYVKRFARESRVGFGAAA